MNPIELTARGSDDVVAYACGKCRRVGAFDGDAEQCCEPRKCGCGAVIGNSYCKPCFEAQIAKTEQARVDGATKVPDAEYDGPVFAERVSGGDWGDGYFSDSDALRDACDGELPAYAWACNSQRMTLDAGGIVESALENSEAHEDAADGITSEAMAELSTFLDGWAEKHGPTSWHPDYSRAIVFKVA